MNGASADGLKVLVADDHQFIRISLQKILRQMGAVEVTTASDGDEVIDAVRSADLPFDLIICDLQMPGRDGIQVLRDLANLNITADIILMSGEDQSILESATNLAIQHGLAVLGHAAKPVSADNIAKLIANHGRAHRAHKKTESGHKIDEEEIRRGLRADELYVLYQPKILVADESLWGAEVLVRWRHPTYGSVSPAEFIPIAEQSSVIDLLTETVLQQALTGFELFRSRGLQMHIAINLSTRSVANLELPNRLAQALERQRVNPADVVLEVTESRIADNLSTFIECATRLRLKGFKLAIDDFGTGYSTMEQLSRLPFSELKVDRAFVAGTPSNDRTRSILEASLTLTRALNLKSVCEGVEHRSEWDLIKSLGADCAQGYFIAKPMTVTEFIEWHQNWSTAH